MARCMNSLGTPKIRLEDLEAAGAYWVSGSDCRPIEKLVALPNVFLLELRRPSHVYTSSERFLQSSCVILETARILKALGGKKTQRKPAAQFDTGARPAKKRAEVL